MSNTRFNLTFPLGKQVKRKLDRRPHRVLWRKKMLFVFDLDGTLLNSKKEISESNKKLFKNFLMIYIVLAMTTMTLECSNFVKMP